MTQSAQTPSTLQTHLKTLYKLLPYLWPKHSLQMRARVILSIILLLIAKLVNISVPYIYKESLDALTTKEFNNFGLISLPIILIGLYGLARLIAQVFNEFKDYIFAPITQQTVRQLSLETFNQLHLLGLRFHLKRKTGALSRIIEKGVQGVENVLRFSLFSILPVSIEIIFVTFVLGFIYGWLLTSVTVITLVTYIAFTLMYSQLREHFVRMTNNEDIQANAIAIDSLINYETVKYFNNEEHESMRYESSLLKYQNAAIHSARTLSLLNIGQNLIISFGLVIVMIITVRGIQQNTLTLGDFILVNTYLIQLYIPLNNLGFAYREIRFGLLNMQYMFNLLQ